MGVERGDWSVKFSLNGSTVIRAQCSTPIPKLLPRKNLSLGPHRLFTQPAEFGSINFNESKFWNGSVGEISPAEKSLFYIGTYSRPASTLWDVTVHIPNAAGSFKNDISMCTLSHKCKWCVILFAEGLCMRRQLELPSESREIELTRF